MIRSAAYNSFLYKNIGFSASSSNATEGKPPLENATALLTVIPNGVGSSLSSYIALCVKVFDDLKRKTGLQTETHANGTNMYGSMDDVFAAIKGSHQKLHEAGCPRVTSVVTISTRAGVSQNLERKMVSLEEKIGLLNQDEQNPKSLQVEV